MDTKQQIIFRVLDRRLREAAHRKGVTPVVAARAVGDRFQFTATSFRTDQARNIPGFVPTQPHLIRQRSDAWSAYSHVRPFRSQDGKTTVAVLSHPRKPWLEPFRPEIIPDDATGLLPRHVLPFWKLTSGQRIRLAEWAIDLPPTTQISGERVRRNGHFGKCRPLEERYFGYGAWGSRKGGKYIRSYYKYAIEAQRVEFELRQRFLESHGIESLSDLWKLGEILPGAHIRFVRIDDSRVAQRLRNRSKKSKIPETLERLSELKPKLHDALAYLRGQGMLNVHRFLVPLKVNELVRDAAGKFSRDWDWV